ncbi:MAG: LamG domain-containing protein [Deltaproteobacteria bacterium]|nr:LamG domain-containing protein [Deltaproteobacteria bacterium]
MEAWIRIDEVRGEWQAIVQKVDLASYTYGYSIRLDAANHLQFFVANSSEGTACSVTDANPIPEGDWLHIAGTFDSGSCSLFLGGTAVDSEVGTIETVGYHTDSLFIGHPSSLNPGGFVGAIDEVRISSTARYSGAFTPNSEFSVDADTSALWHMDEGVGVSVGDVSGNNNVGTLNGGDWIIP